MLRPPKTVLLAGATGYIGQSVAAALVARGDRVLALVRDAGRAQALLPGCTLIEATVTDAKAVRAALGEQSYDQVVSCLASRNGAPDDSWRIDYEANRQLLDLAIEAGAKRFTLLSAICVQRPRLAFQQAKLGFEKTLREAAIEHTIIRPTAFFKSLSGQIQRVLDGRPFLIFGDGELTACKPIDDADLAAFMLQCLDDPTCRNVTLPIGGPGPAISPREQGELLFELTGQPARFRSVSPRLFTLLAGALAPFARLSSALAARAEFLRIAHYYATESMLLWDAERGCYSADATPETGSKTLRAHYREVLQDGLGRHGAGDHQLF